MRAMLRGFGLLLVAGLLGVPMANAAATCGSGDNWKDNGHPYEKAAGDVVQPGRFEASRTVSGSGNLRLDVCDADVKVRTANDAKTVRVMLDWDVASGNKGVVEAVREFRVDGTDAVIRLDFPKGSHAQVTVVLPMGAGSHTEINVGRGTLQFNAVRSAGDREINVGMGSATLLLDGTKNYKGLQVNVGMGKFQDERPGGTTSHFATSKSFGGAGEGQVEVNVGMGSLTLRND